MEDLLVNSRVRIFEDIIYIKRRLGGSNLSIEVKIGQEVAPDDMLGSSETSAGFVTVNLADKLREEPKTAVSFLRRKLGDAIFEGELLAEKGGYLGVGNKLLVSPGDGVLDFYDTTSGILRIKLTPKKQKLISGVYGVVDNINISSGEILIRTLAKIIFGLFGSGMERSGILKVLGSREILVSSSQLDGRLASHIIVGGGVVFLDALQKAVHLKVSGIITGGMNAADFKAMKGGKLDFSHKNMISDIGVGVMATEGFGTIPIGEDLFEVMKNHNGKFCILNGNLGQLILLTQDIGSMISIRRTKIPDGKLRKSEVVSTSLRIGVKVRIIYSLNLGVQGMIVSLDKVPTLLPSGVSTIMTTVKVGLKSLRVPYNNLEVIS